MEKILILGFRGDTYRLDDAYKSNFKDKKIASFKTRTGLKEHLDKYAKSIPNTEFRVDFGFEMNSDYYEIWPQYTYDDVKLFVASNVTRDGQGDDTYCMSNGEEFAKILFPETPKIILHFSTSYWGSSKVDSNILKGDYEDRVYHLPRSIRDQDFLGLCNGLLVELSDKILKYDREDQVIPFNEYMQIFNKINKEVNH